MSPIGVISALAALYLGFAGPKFWWKGLAIVGALAVVFVAAGIAAMRIFGYPIVVDLDLSPSFVAQMIATVLAYMLLFYGAGCGAHWAMKRRKSR